MILKLSIKLIVYYTHSRGHCNRYKKGDLQRRLTHSPLCPVQYSGMSHSLCFGRHTLSDPLNWKNNESFVQFVIVLGTEKISACNKFTLQFSQHGPFQKKIVLYICTYISITRSKFCNDNLMKGQSSRMLSGADPSENFYEKILAMGQHEERGQGFPCLGHNTPVGVDDISLTSSPLQNSDRRKNRKLTSSRTLS